MKKTKPIWIVSMSPPRTYDSRNANKRIISILALSLFIVFLVCSYPGTCFGSVLCIIAVMALLAQSTKIIWVTILWLMVEMGYCQNYMSKFTCLLIPTVGVILNATELTAVIGSLQYGCSYLFPVGRITALILWSYWHIISFLCHTTTLSVWYVHLRLSLSQTIKLL